MSDSSRRRNVLKGEIVPSAATHMRPASAPFRPTRLSRPFEDIFDEAAEKQKEIQEFAEDRLRQIGNSHAEAIRSAEISFQRGYEGRILGNIRAKIAARKFTWDVLDPEADQARAEMAGIIREGYTRVKDQVARAQDTINDQEALQDQLDLDMQVQDHRRQNQLLDINVELFRADQQGEVMDKFQDRQHVRDMFKIEKDQHHELDVMRTAFVLNLETENNRRKALEGDMGTSRVVAAVNAMIGAIDPLLEGKSAADQEGLNDILARIVNMNVETVLEDNLAIVKNTNRQLFQIGPGEPKKSKDS